MKDSMRHAGGFLRDAVQESTRQALSDRQDDMIRRGFSSAAGITLRRLEEMLDSLKEQMKTAGLSEADQALFVQLDGVKSHLESDYDRYWQGTGVDWRPPRPIARAVIRRTEES